MSGPPDAGQGPINRAGKDASDGRGGEIPAVYDELRTMAANYLHRQRPDHTLQPTALVHEAFMRLVQQSKSNDVTGSDLVRMAARAMRSVLVDHARLKAAKKRSATGDRLPLDAAEGVDGEPEVDVLAVDEALVRLADLEPQWRLIVELRFFGGCSEDEIAGLLDLTTRTVQRQWRMAKAWLRSELNRGQPDGP